MYDIRHRLIWAVSGFVAAVSLLVLVTLAGYGFLKALLLSALILSLVALVLWILWISEPESLVDMLAAPPPELPRPQPEPVLPPEPAGAPVAAPVPGQVLRTGQALQGGAVPPVMAVSDDLKKINGIGPQIEALLHREGVTLLAQIAAWDDAEIDRIDALLRFHGRIRRDDWTGQARSLQAGAGAPGARPATEKGQ